MNTKLLLKKSLEIFPVEDIGKDFRGTHGLNLIDGVLTLRIWSRGHIWPIVLDEEEEKCNNTEEDIVSFLTVVKTDIDKYPLSTVRCPRITS